MATLRRLRNGESSNSAFMNLHKVPSKNLGTTLILARDLSRRWSELSRLLARGQQAAGAYSQAILNSDS